MSEPDRKIVGKQSAQRSLRLIAVILLGFGLLIAYWLWPDGITQLSWASFTPLHYFKVVAAGLVVVIALCLAVAFWIE